MRSRSRKSRKGKRLFRSIAFIIVMIILFMNHKYDIAICGTLGLLCGMEWKMRTKTVYKTRTIYKDKEHSRKR